MALVDFTNPDAVKWYQGYLRQLCEMGVDCFKTDFGERIPVQDPYYGPKAAKYGIRYFDGSDPRQDAQLLHLPLQQGGLRPAG